MLYRLKTTLNTLVRLSSHYRSMPLFYGIKQKKIHVYLKERLDYNFRMINADGS